MSMVTPQVYLQKIAGDLSQILGWFIDMNLTLAWYGYTSKGSRMVDDNPIHLDTRYMKVLQSLKKN